MGSEVLRFYMPYNISISLPNINAILEKIKILSKSFTGNQYLRIFKTLVLMSSNSHWCFWDDLCHFVSWCLPLLLLSIVSVLSLFHSFLMYMHTYTCVFDDILTTIIKFHVCFFKCVNVFSLLIYTIWFGGRRLKTNSYQINPYVS